MANWFTRAGSSIWDGVTATPGAIASAASSTWNWTTSTAPNWVAGTAAPWVANTAAPAVGDAALYVAAATPLLSETLLLGDMLGQQFSGSERGALGMAERRAEVRAFGNYAWNNPGRASSLAAQGVVNGFAGIAGMAGDAVRIVADDVLYTSAENLVKGAVNLGLEEGNQIPYRERSSFQSLDSAFRWSNEFKEAVKFTADIQGEIVDARAFVQSADGTWVKNEGHAIIDNPNAKYERIFLYVPQVFTEAVATVATGGVAGAAYGAARGGVVAARSALTGVKVAQEGAVVAAAVDGGTVAVEVAGVTARTTAAAVETTTGAAQVAGASVNTAARGGAAQAGRPFWDEVRIGARQGLHIVDPRHGAGLAVESAVVGGSALIGIYTDAASARARSDAEQDAAGALALSGIALNVPEDLDAAAARAQAILDGGEAPAGDLTLKFAGISGPGGGSASAAGNNGGDLSNGFGNRAAGITMPLDQPIVLRGVSEETVAALGLTRK